MRGNEEERTEVAIFGFLIGVFVIWGLGHMFGWWGSSNADKLRAALQDANAQIDACNQQIYDAKNLAWADYQTMGNTLEGLTGCDDVPDPTQN